MCGRERSLMQPKLNLNGQRDSSIEVWKGQGEGRAQSVCGRVGDRLNASTEGMRAQPSWGPGVRESYTASTMGRFERSMISLTPDRTARLQRVAWTWAFLAYRAISRRVSVPAFGAKSRPIPAPTTALPAMTAVQRATCLPSFDMTTSF